MTSLARTIAALAFVTAATGGGASAASPQRSTEYGIDFVAVGAPGNAPTPPKLYPTLPPRELGAVDHEYRLARTEMTVGRWFEFVNAYRPFNTGLLTDRGLTGYGINFILGAYELAQPDGWPTTMSWEYAARYCNWLHNAKALTSAAFERGVYDTSTFTRNPDGTFNHQLAHSPGARFWIPTEDEWVKGAYYDPDRFGPGQGGYWINPGSQDDLLISGPPEAGGQTNAGLAGGPREVGSYPGVQSPWGLLDASGGEAEWTESVTDPFSRDRFARGSRHDDEIYFLRDPIEFEQAFGARAPFAGLRLAAEVPPPSSMIFAFLGITVSRSRRSMIRREPCQQMLARG